MTTKTNDMIAQELREQAYEVRQLEQALIDQLDSLPYRVAEAKEAARQRYAAMYADLMAGRSTEEPYWDFSEAEAIEATKPDLQAKAKQYGIDRFDLEARAYALDEQEHQATYESLAEPERHLEAEKARIDAELKKVRNARMTAASRKGDATKQRLSFERAAAFHRQSDDVQRRMG